MPSAAASFSFPSGRNLGQILVAANADGLIFAHLYAIFTLHDREELLARLLNLVINHVLP